MRDHQAEGSGRLWDDDRRELRRLLHGQIGWLGLPPLSRVATLASCPWPRVRAQPPAITSGKEGTAAFEVPESA
jgi:hypothetical protein